MKYLLKSLPEVPDWVFRLSDTNEGRFQSLRLSSSNEVSREECCVMERMTHGATAGGNHTALAFPRKNSAHLEVEQS